MFAIAKMRPAPGLDLIEVEEPTIRPGCVKLKLEAASVCGTDLHIYNWDAWAAGRIHPPRITGHEFCGTIVEVADDVTDRKVGDFVASESHIVCGKCRQCLLGQAHVCIDTQILGVDVDGGFAEYAVIPAANARVTPKGVSPIVAAFQDALGNAVHTVLAGPVEGQSILITGMGPIGLFAVSICKALGAKQIITTEVSPFRTDLALKSGADLVINPLELDAKSEIRRLCPDGVDGVLEMSGHSSMLSLAVDVVRPGGRLSLLGVYADPMQSINVNELIFKGVEVQPIVGRKLWQTWDQMGELLAAGNLNLDPVVTHVMKITEYDEAFALMKAGKAGKVVFTF